MTPNERIVLESVRDFGFPLKCLAAWAVYRPRRPMPRKEDLIKAVDTLRWRKWISLDLDRRRSGGLPPPWDLTPDGERALTGEPPAADLNALTPTERQDVVQALAAMAQGAACAEPPDEAQVSRLVHLARKFCPIE